MTSLTHNPFSVLKDMKIEPKPETAEAPAQAANDLTQAPAEPPAPRRNKFDGLAERILAEQATKGLDPEVKDCWRACVILKLAFRGRRTQYDVQIPYRARPNEARSFCIEQELREANGYAFTQNFQEYIDRTWRTEGFEPSPKHQGIDAYYEDTASEAEQFLLNDLWYYVVDLFYDGIHAIERHYENEANRQRAKEKAQARAARPKKEKRMDMTSSDKVADATKDGIEEQAERPASDTAETLRPPPLETTPPAPEPSPTAQVASPPPPPKERRLLRPRAERAERPAEPKLRLDAPILGVKATEQKPKRDNVIIDHEVFEDAHKKAATAPTVVTKAQPVQPKVVVTEQMPETTPPPRAFDPFDTPNAEERKKDAATKPVDDVPPLFPVVERSTRRKQLLIAAIAIAAIVVLALTARMRLPWQDAPAAAKAPEATPVATEAVPTATVAPVAPPKTGCHPMTAALLEEHFGQGDVARYVPDDKDLDAKKPIIRCGTNCRINADGTINVSKASVCLP